MSLCTPIEKTGMASRFDADTLHYDAIVAKGSVMSVVPDTEGNVQQCNCFEMFLQWFKVPKMHFHICFAYSVQR